MPELLRRVAHSGHGTVNQDQGVAVDALLQLLLWGTKYVMNLHLHWYRILVACSCPVVVRSAECGVSERYP